MRSDVEIPQQLITADARARFVHWCTALPRPAVERFNAMLDWERRAHVSLSMREVEAILTGYLRGPDAAAKY